MVGFLSEEQVRLVFRLRGPLERALLPFWIIEKESKAYPSSEPPIRSQDGGVYGKDVLRRVCAKKRTLRTVSIREDRSDLDPHCHIRFLFSPEGENRHIAEDSAFAVLEELLGRRWQSVAIYKNTNYGTAQVNISFGRELVGQREYILSPCDHWGIQQVHEKSEACIA